MQMTTTKRQRKMSYRSSVTLNFVYATKFCFQQFLPSSALGPLPRALHIAQEQLARFPTHPFFRPVISEPLSFVSMLPLTCCKTLLSICARTSARDGL